MKYSQIRNILGKSDVIIPLRFFYPYVFIAFFVTNTLHAKTDVVFSPRGSIKDTIVEYIDSSEKSINIAVLIFTSGDIAEALYKAKERGVKIRIIVDQRQRKKRYPVIEYLKEEGFDLQFLKGNIGGFMNNTFAIFDDKYLVTGSYNWTEYAEKFNYENALFIDEPGVIKRFQEEFELLYDKSIVQRVADKEESGFYVPASKVEALSGSSKEEVLSVLDSEHIKKEKMGKELSPKDNITISFTRKKDRLTETNVEKRQAVSTIETSNDFIDISFNEFDNIFGKESKLNKAEKKQIWKDKFVGKYVRWTGRIGYKGIAVYDWNKMGVRHKDSNIDVKLRFDWTKQRKVLQLDVGDVITYTGRLVSLGGFLSPYRLDDADVLGPK